MYDAYIALGSCPSFIVHFSCPTNELIHKSPLRCTNLAGGGDIKWVVCV